MVFQYAFTCCRLGHGKFSWAKIIAHRTFCPRVTMFGYELPVKVETRSYLSSLFNTSVSPPNGLKNRFLTFEVMYWRINNNF